MCMEDRELFYSFADQFYNSEAVMHPIPTDYHVKAFEEMMRSDVYIEGYIFEFEGKPVGYAMTSKAFSHESGGITLWVDELYIKEAYRSKGLGKEFFSYIHGTASAFAARLRLEVEPDNLRAIKL